MFLCAKFSWSIFAFTKIDGPNDITFCATSIVILVSKGPGLPWDEHEARACVLIHPLGHTFIDTVDPRWDEFFCHVVIPTLKHPPDLPKRITKGRWISRSVHKIVEYILKAISRHKRSKTERSTLEYVNVMRRPKGLSIRTVDSRHKNPQTNPLQ